MTMLPIPIPHISTVFEEYFAVAVSRARPLTVKRILAVRGHLERFLDEQGERILTTSQQAILRAEQEFNPAGAFARTMYPDDLFYALYSYLNPKYRLTDRIDAAAQLRVVGGLAQWMWSKGLLDELTSNSCIVLDVEAALKHARRSLATDRDRHRDGLPPLAPHVF